METTAMQHRRLLCAAALSLAAACGGGPAAVEYGLTEHGSPQLVSRNGKSMNGPVLNGKSMNGTGLSSLYVRSVNLASATLGGDALDSVALNGSALSARAGSNGNGNGKGKKLGATDFVGATFTATLSDGSTLPLSVGAVAQLAAPNADLLGYSVSYPTAAGPQALCGYEADGSAVLAVPVAGSFNYAQGVPGGGSYTASAEVFTFACRHYAVAKCMELGYQPWKTRDGGTLQNAWVACTRMLRADYCGDGTPNTVNGTIIDVYDRYHIQTMSMPTWPVEAEWSPDGAGCMTPDVVDRFVLAGAPTPVCYAAKLQSGCGTFSSPSTYLIDGFRY